MLEEEEEEVMGGASPPKLPTLLEEEDGEGVKANRKGVGVLDGEIPARIVVKGDAVKVVLMSLLEVALRSTNSGILRRFETS